MPAASGARTQIAVERAGHDLPLRLLHACWIRASYDRFDSTFRPAVLSVQRSKWAALSLFERKYVRWPTVIIVPAMAIT